MEKQCHHVTYTLRVKAGILRKVNYFHLTRYVLAWPFVTQQIFLILGSVFLIILRHCHTSRRVNASFEEETFNLAQATHFHQSTRFEFELALQRFGNLIRHMDASRGTV